MKYWHGCEATGIVLLCLAGVYVGSKGMETQLGKVVELKKHKIFMTF